MTRDASILLENRTEGEGEKRLEAGWAIAGVKYGGNEYLRGDCTSKREKDRASRQTPILNTTDHGITDELAMRKQTADETAGINIPRIKANGSLFPDRSMFRGSLQPLLYNDSTSFCTMPMDHPLKKVQVFSSDDFSHVYHLDPCRK